MIPQTIPLRLRISVGCKGEIFFSCSGRPQDKVAVGWFVEGGVLGLAADLDIGSLQTCTDGVNWVAAFDSGLRAGKDVGPGLYPALCGGKGSTVRCNFGLDQSFVYNPPSDEYKAISAAITRGQVH
jgi:hypothetical protein